MDPCTFQRVSWGQNCFDNVKTLLAFLSSVDICTDGAKAVLGRLLVPQHETGSRRPRFLVVSAFQKGKPHALLWCVHSEGLRVTNVYHLDPLVHVFFVPCERTWQEYVKHLDHMWWFSGGKTFVQLFEWCAATCRRKHHLSFREQLTNCCSSDLRIWQLFSPKWTNRGACQGKLLVFVAYHYDKLMILCKNES